MGFAAFSEDNDLKQNQSGLSRSSFECGLLWL